MRRPRKTPSKILKIFSAYASKKTFFRLFWDFLLGFLRSTHQGASIEQSLVLFGSVEATTKNSVSFQKKIVYKDWEPSFLTDSRFRKFLTIQTIAEAPVKFETLGKSEQKLILIFQQSILSWLESAYFRNIWQNWILHFRDSTLQWPFFGNSGSHEIKNLFKFRSFSKHFAKQFYLPC